MSVKEVSSDVVTRAPRGRDLHKPKDIGDDVHGRPCRILHQEVRLQATPGEMDLQQRQCQIYRALSQTDICVGRQAGILSLGVFVRQTAYLINSKPVGHKKEKQGVCYDTNVVEMSKPPLRDFPILDGAVVRIEDLLKASNSATEKECHRARSQCSYWPTLPEFPATG